MTHLETLHLVKIAVGETELKNIDPTSMKAIGQNMKDNLGAAQKSYAQNYASGMDGINEKVSEGVAAAGKGIENTADAGKTIGSMLRNNLGRGGDVDNLTSQVKILQDRLGANDASNIVNEEGVAGNVAGIAGNAGAIADNQALQELVNVAQQRGIDLNAAQQGDAQAIQELRNLAMEAGIVDNTDGLDTNWKYIGDNIGQILELQDSQLATQNNIGEAAAYGAGAGGIFGAAKTYLANRMKKDDEDKEGYLGNIGMGSLAGAGAGGAYGGSRGARSLVPENLQNLIG